MRFIFMIISMLGVFLAASAASAQVNSVTIAVDGLACPFCAYGVEKKLKRVEGVDSMDIRMREGTVTLTAGEGLSIDFEEVPGAVRDSGFSMREMRITATGVVIREDGDFFLQYGEPGERLALKDMYPALRDEFSGYAEGGETVVASGRVTGKPGGQWVLKPESVGVVPE